MSPDVNPGTHFLFTQGPFPKYKALYIMLCVSEAKKTLMGSLRGIRHKGMGNFHLWANVKS